MPQTHLKFVVWWAICMQKLHPDMLYKLSQKILIIITGKVYNKTKQNRESKFWSDSWDVISTMVEWCSWYYFGHNFTLKTHWELFPAVLPTLEHFKTASGLNALFRSKHKKQILITYISYTYLYTYNILNMQLVT